MQNCLLFLRWLLSDSRRQYAVSDLMYKYGLISGGCKYGNMEFPRAARFYFGGSDQQDE